MSHYMYIMSHYITSHYITLRYITCTLCYITLQYANARLAFFWWCIVLIVFLVASWHVVLSSPQQIFLRQEWTSSLACMMLMTMINTGKLSSSPLPFHASIVLKSFLDRDPL